MSDNVNNPAHYKAGGIEAIDVIEAFELGHHLGNVVAYVLRADRKGAALQDLMKARWYIDREINRRSGVPLVETDAERAQRLERVMAELKVRVREHAKRISECPDRSVDVRARADALLDLVKP